MSTRGRRLRGGGEKMPAARASILQRPLRTPHPSAGESAEREYQEEQARLQAKRERYQETETFVRTMLNPSATERRNFQYVFRLRHFSNIILLTTNEHRGFPSPCLTSTPFLTFGARPLSVLALSLSLCMCVRAQDHDGKYAMCSNCGEAATGARTA